MSAAGARAPGEGTGCRDAAGVLAVGASVLAGGLLSAAFLPQLAAIPLALLAVGVISLIGWLVARPRGPRRVLALRVLELRARIAGRGPAGEHRCTLVAEDEDGARHELEVHVRAAESLAPGALGIASTRGPRLEHWTTLIPPPRPR